MAKFPRRATPFTQADPEGPLCYVPQAARAIAVNPPGQREFRFPETQPDPVQWIPRLVCGLLGAEQQPVHADVGQERRRLPQPRPFPG